MLNRLYSKKNDYGERSKKASKGVDYKSLSHTLRIILEFEELLTTHFITFPIKEKNIVCRVKCGDLSDFNNSYENILEFLDKKVETIQNKLIFESLLPSKLNDMVLNKILIKLLSA